MFYGSTTRTFTIASRTALEPTQPPIQWVPVVISLGIKRPRPRADKSPPSSAKAKECGVLYLHYPQYDFMAWSSVTAQGQLYCTLLKLCQTSTLRTRTEMVFETLVCSPLNHLTRLIARENFIILSRRKSNKSQLVS
jgi:hypothetical protein